MFGCFLCVPYWGPALQPRHVPQLGIEPATLWFTSWHSIHWATPARLSQYLKLLLVALVFLLAGHQISEKNPPLLALIWNFGGGFSLGHGAFGQQLLPLGSNSIGGSVLCIKFSKILSWNWPASMTKVYFLIYVYILSSLQRKKMFFIVINTTLSQTPPNKYKINVMDWMCFPTPNIYVEILTPNVIMQY